MPDFLHRDPPSKESPNPETPASSPGLSTPKVTPPKFAVSPAPGPRSVEAMSRRPGGPASPGANGDTEGDLPGRKPPSKLFVEYYAVLFLALVTAFLFAGFFLLRPLIFEYRKLQGTLQSTATLVSDERGYLESLQQSVTAAQSIPPETLADVEEALPREPGIPKLLQMLSLLAEQNDVPLNSVQFTTSKTQSTEGSTIESTDIGISVSSKGYAGTRRYLDALEHNLRIFDLGAVTFSPGVGDASSWAYSLQLRTYALPDEKTPLEALMAH